MAPNTNNEPRGLAQRTLHVWSKPLEHQDEPQPATGEQEGEPSRQTARPTFSEAIAMIKREDFANIASTPCSRQGFLMGIASGAGFGGLKFVLHGNAIKAANWAVGMFVLGSMASYEYCQYQRRAERIQMKRQIEIVSEARKEKVRKTIEERGLEQERNATQRPWYRFW